MTAKRPGPTIEQNKIRPSRRTWDVVAPDGYHFAEGPHVLVRWSLKEAEQERDTAELEPCLFDCECGEGQLMLTPVTP